MAFIYKLEYAVAMGLLDQNPTARIRNTRGAAIPLVLVGTGLRPEELFALERRDLDLEAGALNIERVYTQGRLKEPRKSSRQRRRVPLPNGS